MGGIEKKYGYRAVQKAQEQGITRPGDIIAHIDRRNVSVSMIQLTHITRRIKEIEEVE